MAIPQIVPSTPEEAVALAETRWWIGEDPKIVAEWQLTTPLLSMGFGDFHEAVEKALGRPVWTHEFGQSGLLLIELRGDAPSPTLKQIFDQIPEEKRIVVMPDEEKSE